MNNTTHTEKTICLVDGSGYIFRAFYALPPMTRSDGTPVNALYGFITMLMNLVQENRCSHIVVVFDAKRKNFRNDIYPAYKENRKETPPELIPQFPLIRQAVKAFSIPFEEQEGYEADDLIATYARLALEQGFTVRIISADKDLMQLIRPGVTLYDPMKKKNVSDEDVRNKFGVSPDKVTEVQALMGDSTDNVPGASGIGPKTAAKLINAFGSISNLYQHLSEVMPEKQRQKLSDDKELVLISKQLVQLNDQVPVSTQLAAFKAHPLDINKCRLFLEENNFKSLISKLPTYAVTVENASEKEASFDVKETKSTQTSASLTQEYHLIRDISTLQSVLNEARRMGRLALDTETTGLNLQEDTLVGFSLCCIPGQAWYVPLKHGLKKQLPDLFGDNIDLYPHQIEEKQALALLKEILADDKVEKIGHNIKFDMHVLNKASPGIKLAPVQDTMLMSYILDGTTHSHKLDTLAQLFLNYKTLAYKELCGSGRSQIGFETLEPEKACFYACEDADITLRLYDILNTRLRQKSEDKSAFIYDSVDRPLIQILFDMERQGILLDKTHLSLLQQEFNARLNSLTQEIYLIAGEEFNINSPAQLGVILFEKQKLQGGKKGPGGNWITDAAVLETLARDQSSKLAEKILTYRLFSKLKSTYADALLDLTRHDQRVHTWFSQTTTNTGRLSSTDPNLQNIPIRTQEGKQIRRSFIAKPGYWLVAADYSQIELRLMACVADVPNLKDSFIKNEDIHARTASEIFGVPLESVDSDLRRRAKTINFGIIYGISAFGLSNQLGIERHEAKQYIDAYFEKYPQIKSYVEQTSAFVKQNGFVLTPFGRKCFIQGIHTPATRSFALRSAVNAPIQGGAADIIKLAMQAVTQAIQAKNLDATLLLQVHDELVFEVKEEDVLKTKILLKEIMEHVVKMPIPFTVDVGSALNWKEAH